MDMFVCGPSLAVAVVDALLEQPALWGHAHRRALWLREAAEGTVGHAARAIHPSALDDGLESIFF